jgi:hypothetical protein
MVVNNAADVAARLPAAFVAKVESGGHLDAWLLYNNVLARFLYNNVLFVV